MEKNERRAMKRNLEGNSKNSNSFASLSNDEVVYLSTNMGISFSKDDFDTFNLIKDLERQEMIYMTNKWLRNAILKLNQLRICNLMCPLWN